MRVLTDHSSIIVPRVDSPELRLDEHVYRSECDLEIIVPAYNEESRLPATLAAVNAELDRLDDLSSRIVVVDNGSSDRTADIVDRFVEHAGARDRVVVIGCAQRGKGAAVRRGVTTSRARYVGFVDADLAVPAAAIHDVIELLTEGADVVIGSRRCIGANYVVHQPVLRRCGSWAFRQAIRDLVPGVLDTQCGFKFFTADAASRVFESLGTTGFCFDVELLAHASRAGYRIAELPVDWSDGASSTLSLTRHGSQIVREIHRLRAGGRGARFERVAA